VTAWGVLAILAAMVPGAMFTWSFDTQARSADSLWDRSLRVVAASALAWIVLAIPLGALWAWLGPGAGRGMTALGVALALSLLALAALPAWAGHLAGRAVAGTLERAAGGRGALGGAQVRVGRARQRLALGAPPRPPRAGGGRGV
jgi:hypothetical protein